MKALPHTMTGKRLEVPVKRLLQGATLEQVANPAAVDDPSALSQFVLLADRRRELREVVPSMHMAP